MESSRMILSVVFIGGTVPSTILSGFGIARRSPALLVIAAVLAAPLAYYLGATPRFRTIGFFLPLPQLLAAVVVRQQRWLATLLVIPLLVVAMWLAVVVMRQNAGAA
jgi:hypothetical protein